MPGRPRRGAHRQLRERSKRRTAILVAWALLLAVALGLLLHAAV